MGDDVEPLGGPTSAEAPRLEPRSGSSRARRKFAKDVGIVVLGVLLALGAERAARAADEAHDAAETRTVAKRELAEGFGSAMTRLKAQQCILRRLEDVAALILDNGQEGFVTPNWIGRPPFDDFEAAGWNAAEQAGRTALIGQEERARFGGLYGSLHRLNAIEQDEQRVWAELRQLEGAARVDPIMMSSLRLALQHARYLAWDARVTIVQGLQAAKEAGVRTPSQSVRATSSACMPMTTPRPVATARMNAV